MTCPKCGNELQDGNMYCEVCGEEIFIVPEFIPEIELSIEESLSNISMEVDPDKKRKINTANTSTNEEDDFDVLKPAAFNFKMSIGYIIGLIILLLILITGIAITIYHDNSANYQIKVADKYFADGNYKKALNNYGRAIEISPADIDYRIKMADCYLAMENIDMAIDVFKDMIVYDPDSSLAYAQIISLYEKYGSYDAIDDFLQHYANDKIRAEYIDYLATVPVFNYESGEYDELIQITLSNESSGLIYYTVGGEEPNESSPIYTEPIRLKRGHQVVKAFFENEYGVCSSIVTKEFDLLMNGPDAPVISLESGEYDVPQVISVIIPPGCSVYYTLDGSDPDCNSRIYGEPIPLERGESHYRFVTIDSKGLSSEIIDREYSLKIESSFDEEQGQDYLYQYLTNIGYLSDINGTKADYPGRFSYLYSDMRYLNGISIYCYNEYYVYGTAARATTGVVFGIDIVTGNVYFVSHDSNDNYSISPF